MMYLMIGVMAILGAVLGSFACCQAWRMRYREVGEGKRGAGQQARRKDGARSERAKRPAVVKGERMWPAAVKGEQLGARSVCLSCGAQLKWYDNIPVVSWLVLRGRCRRCGGRIGAAEIVTEVLGAVGYAALGWWFGEWMWGMGAEGASLSGVMADGVRWGEWWQWAMLLVLVVTGVGMMILAVYDAKWGRLPVKVLTFLNACAIIMVILRWQASLLMPCGTGGSGGVGGADMGGIGGGANVVGLGSGGVAAWWSGGVAAWWSLAGAVGILAGVYYLLYLGSQERWVGGGDWLLGLAIALLLGDWRLALVEMLVANVITLGVAAGRRMRGGEVKEVALGPGLVAGFVIVWVLQGWILGWFSL